MFKLILHKAAAKGYERQPPKIKARLNKALEQLRRSPYRGANIKRLSGKLANLRRYRVGNLRILYEVHEKEGVVRVLEIGPRGEVYKG